MICSHCGAYNDASAQYCMTCGRPTGGPRSDGPAGSGGSRRGRRAGVWLLLLGAVLLLAGAAVGAFYLWGRDARAHIAYQSLEADGTWSLWVSRPDGSHATEVASGAQYISLPDRRRTWEIGAEPNSPFARHGDGMAYAARQPDDSWGVYYFSTSTGETTVLDQGLDAVDLRFPSTGRWIEWRAQKDDTWSLHLANPAKQSRLNPVAAADELDWETSGDGRHLVVVKSAANGDSLYVSTVDGANANRLAGPSDRVEFLLAEDGTIAYAVGESGEWDVAVAPPDGLDPVLLATRLDGADLVGLAPDGSRLLASLAQDDTLKLVLLNTDGTGQTTLAQDFDYAWATFLDGVKSVLVFTESDQEDLFLMDPDSGTRIPLLRGTFQVDGVTPMPGGHSIVAAYERDGDWRLDSFDLDSGARNALFSDADEADAPVPLGKRRVLFSARDGEQWSLYQVSLEGGERTRLAGPVDQIWGYTASPDGQWVIYSEESLGVIRIFRVDAEGEHRLRVAYNGIGPVWSP